MTEVMEDGGQDPKVERSWLTRLNPLKRSRKPPVPEHRAVSPEYRAGFFSLLTFEWMSPIMFVGYQRPLELNDIWLINPNRAVHVGSARLKESFDRHVKAGAKRPLLRAMFDAYRTDIVLGGLCCLLGNLTQVILPFVLKYLITFATDAFVARQLGHEAPAIGTGIGWVFGLTAMQILGSIGNNHFMYRGMVVGGQLRSALISLIFQKAMTISGRAKAGWEAPTVPPQHIKPDSDDEKNWYAEQMGKKVENKQGWSNGRIINLMSTDTNRVDMASGWFHMIWVAPLSMLVTIALLLINLNYSALPGIALFLIAVPLMSVAVRSMFRRRLKANKITDKRVSLTQEVLQAIRFVKLYAWEMNFLDRIDKLRHDEIRTVQIILSIRNAINAVGVSIPLFSSMLAFITYSLSRHPLNPAPIFSSLTLFNQLRFPLVLLPMIIGLVTDALSSVGRIEEFLFAEDLVNNMETVKNAPGAVRLVDASFTWEKVIEGHADSDGISKQEKKQAKEAKKAAIRKGEPIQSESTQPHAEKEQREPFKITNLNIEIGRQEFVAVVGGVGSGKSSLLAALAGDMRKISGTAVLGASRAFCPQNAWIQNATVQDNITFGSEPDESVMEQVIDACTLRQDLEVLPHGRYTEIGERGINLSGGQKQRVNLARAIYSGAEILLMDDPLSAVDAHVGHHIMEHAICGLLKDKCRILATHQLHVLHRCDRIMMMADGKITAFDTFDNLMTNNERFQEMMSTAEWEQEERVMETTSDEATDQPISIVEKTGDKLMQEEGGGLETSSGNVYFHYFKAAGSIFVLPFLLLSLAMSQGGNIVTNLWLAWWSSDAFGFSTGTYIGIYAVIGIIQCILLLVFSISLTVSGTEASKKLLHRAIDRVLRAPMSFFDTTPLGRIMNRFSKDIDRMDNNLTDSMRVAGMTMALIISVFVLIIVYYYYFAAALGPLLLFYISIASYYHSSSNEVKKHESSLRSVLFARFNEAILGTSTIRAYGLTDKIMTTINDAVDEMDSAYFLTFANQRWLGVRLDAIGVLMVFVTEMLVVTTRFNVSPSISGLVLSYLLSIVQMLQFTVRQAADVDNAMLSTDRLLYYGNNIEQEGPAHTVPLADEWPSRGEIIFHNVHMRYRPRLPLALKGFNLHVKPGERIGVVGRTGAGKSSVIMALFRMVELSEGNIEVDGMDIGTVGLEDLRSRMSIIPQDPTLFSGTIRSNLDPFQTHTDLELWSSLRQAHLVEDTDWNPEKVSATETSAETGQHWINLETKVEEGGNNLSHGQRQLLALARALVRGSQIIICDEATSSIDFETDVKIQKAISVGFEGRTLLCVAHRLKTIITYDRICVIDHGGVAEIDTPLALYDAKGIFKSMCDQSSITRETILAAEEDSKI